VWDVWKCGVRELVVLTEERRNENDKVENTLINSPKFPAKAWAIPLP
jgi:hypothetical protein